MASDYLTSRRRWGDCVVYLTEAFVLSADEYSFIVGKPRTRPGRGIVIDRATYHTTAAKAASAAVLRAMRQGVADGSITTLRQFIVEQQRLQTELERLIAPLEGGQERGGQEHEGT